jgi:hypothetical protein
LPDQARKDVEVTAGREADDDAQRPRRVGLGAGDAGHGRQDGRTGGQMQKLPAVKFHDGALR